MIRSIITLLVFFALLRPQQPALFTEAERARVMAYWNTPGRYRIDAPSTPGTNWPWVVRLTPDASLWFYNYNRARGFGKTPPTEVPGAASPEWAEWERWVNAKLAYDRWSASLAATANAAGSPVIGAPPPHPGPIPPDLLAAAGNPPDFAVAVAPLNYTITFDSGEKITYSDHPDMPQRYAYYRFGHGVRFFGTPLKAIPDSELDSAFADAGMSASERRIARAVSVLEGGFESINTYDTGFLSVGFLQFATLEPGAGSLGAVLQCEKANRPQEFEKDFRRFGIDVNEGGALVVIDPSTGAELAGAQAVRKTIDDKRLTAVFQLAGSRSRAFRAAQIRVMKDRYYPAYDTITVAVEDRMFTGRVLDVVRSQAGLATLFDRKVNRGNTDPLQAVVAAVMSKYGLKSLEEAAAYEREIVALLKYRHDFLADASLSQPPVPPVSKTATESVPRSVESDSPSHPKVNVKQIGPPASHSPATNRTPTTRVEAIMRPAAPTPGTPLNPALAPKPTPSEDAPQPDTPPSDRQETGAPVSPKPAESSP